MGWPWYWYAGAVFGTYVVGLVLLPPVLRIALVLALAHRKLRHRMYRVGLEWRRFRRDTPSYRKLRPTWRYRLRYHVSKTRELPRPTFKGQPVVVPVPEVRLSHRLAYRARSEWNRMRDAVAPVVLRRDGYACAWCDTPLHEDNWSIDHIIPLSKGGSNEMHNLQAMCRSCNSQKGDRVDAWGRFWDRMFV
jgi:hypothetical protein